MSKPNRYPLWIFKEKDSRDDVPYTLIYTINTIKGWYMEEYVDKTGDIFPMEKVFRKFNEIKERYFDPECYDLIVYNPEQIKSKYDNFFLTIIENEEDPDFEVLSITNQQNTDDEDPSSEESEDPTSD
jgi:hypothetical protein